jgi:hypothetical protein
MQTKFYGASQNANTRNAVRTAGRFKMNDIKNDIHFYMLNGTNADALNPFDAESDEYAEIESFYERNGGFHEYYDAAEYIPAGQSDNHEGFLCVWFDIDKTHALKIYFSLGESKSSKIEFYYVDFNTGISFSITGEGWAQWFADECVRAKIVDERMELTEGAGA